MIRRADKCRVLCSPAERGRFFFPKLSQITSLDGIQIERVFYRHRARHVNSVVNSLPIERSRLSSQCISRTRGRGRGRGEGYLALCGMSFAGILDLRPTTYKHVILMVLLRQLGMTVRLTSGDRRFSLSASG